MEIPFSRCRNDNRSVGIVDIIYMFHKILKDVQMPVTRRTYHCALASARHYYTIC